MGQKGNRLSIEVNEVRVFIMDARFQYVYCNEQFALDRGLTAEEIGEFIGLSARTVENYRPALRKKLQIKNSSKNLKAVLNGYFSNDM